MARGLSRLGLWIAPLTIGLAAAAVLATGFVLALGGRVGKPLGSAPPKLPPAAARAGSPADDGVFRLLVLGDSLARGTGDDTGRGFALDVLEAFRRRGRAELTNLGVNGTESPEVRELIATPNVRALASRADLILVSAGGNDLSRAAGRFGGSATELADAVTAARFRYVDSLREILRELRAANPAAPIGVLGLYDPFGSESGPGRLGSSVILQWNTLAAETALAFPNVFLIPTFDLFHGRADRLSADRYHPGRKGYALIAERILQVAGS